MVIINGIDIFSGDDVSDWGQLKAGGVQICIQKATQGLGFIDSLLAYRYPRAKAVGIKWGTYHFAGGMPNHTVEQETQAFLNAIAGQTQDTIVFIDIEDYETPNFKKVWGKQEAINWVNTFTRITGAKGLGKGVYCNYSFYNDNLKGNIDSDIVLWIAKYSATPPAEYPNSASWQYSDTARLNGANGDIDVNNFISNIFADGKTIASIQSVGQPTVNIEKVDIYGATTASTLNVRDSASASGNIIGSLSNGSKVHIGGRTPGWFSIYFGDHGGWVSSDYVNLNSTQGTVTATTLNVRDSASTNGAIIGTLSQGTVVKIGEHIAGWYNIFFGAHGGWVSDQYIR